MYVSELARYVKNIDYSIVDKNSGNVLLISNNPSYLKSFEGIMMSYLDFDGDFLTIYIYVIDE